MVRKIKSNMKHCFECGCSFTNYEDPSKCPMCNEKYIKIKKQIMKRKIIGQN